MSTAHKIISTAAMRLMGKARLTPDEDTIIYAWSQVMAKRITWTDAFDALRGLKIL